MIQKGLLMKVELENAIELSLNQKTFATGTRKFRFEKVYISKRAPYPLVRVTYKILMFSNFPVPKDGGLALDVGKCVFIDHFEDEEMESAAERLAPKIAEYVIDYVMELVDQSVTHPSIP
jgi:hypothetical protein